MGPDLPSSWGVLKVDANPPPSVNPRGSSPHSPVSSQYAPFFFSASLSAFFLSSARRAAETSAIVAQNAAEPSHVRRRIGFWGGADPPFLGFPGRGDSEIYQFYEGTGGLAPRCCGGRGQLPRMLAGDRFPRADPPAVAVWIPPSPMRSFSPSKRPAPGGRRCLPGGRSAVDGRGGGPAYIPGRICATRRLPQ